MKRILPFAFAIIFLFTGCSPTVVLRDSSLIDFNKSLQDKFEEISKIKTYIVRPGIHWDITIKDDDQINDIFIYIVDYLKTSNIYENELRNKYTGVKYTDRITISLVYKKTAWKYEGYYYKRGTTVYPDDKNNIVDNFTTWYTYNEKGNETSSYTYEVKENSAKGK